MKDLKVTIIQTPLFWEEPEKNLQMFTQKISRLRTKTDLIILPEMFSTGFTMKPRWIAEKVNGTAMAWMKLMAKKKNCVITGSLAISDKGKYYNRLIWQRPDGSFDSYNKRHLFRFAGEQQVFTPGKKRLVVNMASPRGGDKWNICPMVCYDLRFPVWCRNAPAKSSEKKGRHAPAEFNYDVLIFVANWPERRSHPWKTLLQARAMENQCYVIGVNRIGNDGNGIYHSGDSVVVNPRGEIISKTRAGEESVETVTLSKKELDDWRKGFPAWMDAEEFSIGKKR